MKKLLYIAVMFFTYVAHAMYTSDNTLHMRSGVLPIQQLVNKTNQNEKYIDFTPQNIFICSKAQHQITQVKNGNNIYTMTTVLQHRKIRTLYKRTYGPKKLKPYRKI